jgi:hypothetical protein
MRQCGIDQNRITRVANGLEDNPFAKPLRRQDE